MSRELNRIDDADDDRIAPYRNIRERDLVGRQGRFVAEGKVVLNVLFTTSRFTAESVLLRDNRVDGLEPLLEHIPLDVPIYVAGGTIVDAIAGFHVHRGVLAIGRRDAEEDADKLLSRVSDQTCVVALMGIANHDNLGGIFRNAAAFGADMVLLDQACCDPLYRKAIRVSVGATLKVPFAKISDAETLLEHLSAHGFRIFALSPRGVMEIDDVEPGRRDALLLGAEGPGLPEDLIRRLPSLRIGMRTDFDSLNVAAASAIALHRFRRTDP